MWTAGRAPRRPVAGRPAQLRLGLDLVIWLVSPQNPLKSSRETASLATRMAGAKRYAGAPGMRVSDAETRLGVQYTIDTIRGLKARFPGVCFVWLMGADSLASFHLWRGWTEILQETPMAVVSRPFASLRSRLSPAAQRFARHRIRSEAAASLPCSAPPAWVFLHGPLHFESSTALREQMRDQGLQKTAP
jgi:nicotinate-nucleotide adenylyltransferase